MRLFCLAPLALLLLACGDDLDARPDPSGTSSGAGGATSSSSSGSAGGNETAALGYENGTRLRARVIVGADGSRQFLEWFDTSLNSTCVFAQTAEGMRCVPTNAPIGTSTYPNIYSDPGCTVLLAHSDVPCGDAVGTYVASYLPAAADSCDPPFLGAHRLTTVHNGAVYQGTPANCTQDQSPPNYRWNIAAVEPSGMAGGTVETE